jgi:hypothetical protein
MQVLAFEKRDFVDRLKWSMRRYYMLQRYRKDIALLSHILQPPMQPLTKNRVPTYEAFVIARPFTKTLLAEFLL